MHASVLTAVELRTGWSLNLHHSTNIHTRWIIKCMWRLSPLNDKTIPAIRVRVVCVQYTLHTWLYYCTTVLLYTYILFHYSNTASPFNVRLPLLHSVRLSNFQRTIFQWIGFCCLEHFAIEFLCWYQSGEIDTFFTRFKWIIQKALTKYGPYCCWFFYFFYILLL